MNNNTPKKQEINNHKMTKTATTHKKQSIKLLLIETTQINSKSTISHQK